MFDRFIVTPIIALGLAFLIWVYLRSRDQEVQVYSVPVAITVEDFQADRYVFDSKPDAKMRVKFYGLPARLRVVKEMVELGELTLRRLVRVPAEVDQRLDNEYHETLQIDATALTTALPLGVHAEITAADGRVPVVLKRLIEKTLTVQANVTPAGYELDGPARVEPATVRVTGPKSVLDQVNQLVLETWQPPPPLGLEALTENAVELTSKQRVPTRINREAVKVYPEVVDVRVKVKPALRVYELTDVPIHFLCPADFPYRPQFPTESHATCKVRVRGPANKTPEVRAYIDLAALAAQQALKHGTYPDVVLSIDLPNGFFLDGPPPKLSAFKLVQIDTAAKPPGN